MTLRELNTLDEADRISALTKCCGAAAWVEQMNKIFPVDNEETLMSEAKQIWFTCRSEDWLEAFSHHPKIGDVNALKEKYAATSAWAEGEQSAVKQSPAAILQALAAGNKAYEEKFGYIFIVCATGKSAEEMLALLSLRLTNSTEDEIRIAMREQHTITTLRLKKLLAT